MKKTILSSIFCCLLFSVFAQTAFTEQTLTEHRQALITDGTKWFNDYVPKDFTMTGEDGSVLDHAGMKNLVERSQMLEWPNIDISIKQVGNVAIVKGITRHVFLLKKANITMRVAGQRFTEVYEYQNGKWMYASVHLTPIPAPKADDEAAIKKVCEKETAMWNARDAEQFLSCWHNVPYATQLVAHGVAASNAGVAYNTNAKSNLPEIVKASFATMGKPDGSTFVTDNFVIHINGKSAFVTYDQTNTAIDGTKTTFHEARYLEKVGQEWKIVYVGAVKYPLISK